MDDYKKVWNRMVKGRVPKKHIGKPPSPPKKCVACNGSGYYDVSNSPKCSECKGTGYDR